MTNKQMVVLFFDDLPYFSSCTSKPNFQKMTEQKLCKSPILLGVSLDLPNEYHNKSEPSHWPRLGQYRQVLSKNSLQKHHLCLKKEKNEGALLGNSTDIRILGFIMANFVFLCLDLYHISIASQGCHMPQLHHIQK